MLPAHVFVVLSDRLLLVFRGQAVVLVILCVLEQVVLQKSAAGEAPPTGQTRVEDIPQALQAQLAPLGVVVTKAGVLDVLLESTATVTTRRACTSRVDVRRGCISGAALKEAAGRHNGLDIYRLCSPLPGVRAASGVLRAVTRDGGNRLGGRTPLACPRLPSFLACPRLPSFLACPRLPSFLACPRLPSFLACPRLPSFLACPRLPSFLACPRLPGFPGFVRRPTACRRSGAVSGLDTGTVRTAATVCTSPRPACTRRTRFSPRRDAPFASTLQHSWSPTGRQGRIPACTRIILPPRRRALGAGSGCGRGWVAVCDDIRKRRRTAFWCCR